MAVYPDINDTTDESVVHSYDKQLQYRSNHNDAWMGLEGVVPGGDMSKAPDAVMFRHDLKDMAVDTVSRMAMPLEGPVGMGDNQTRENTGTELAYLTLKGRANTYFKVLDQKDVKRTLSGYAKGLALLNAGSVALEEYMQRTRGSFGRQGFLDGCSLNLTSAAAGGPALTPSRPKNIWIHGATVQPTFSATPATYDASIRDSLLTVDISNGAKPIVDTFNRLNYQAFQRARIKAIGGEYGGNVVGFCHSGLATILRENQTAGSLNALRFSSFSAAIAAKAFSNDLGQLGRFLLNEDASAPIMVLTKSTGAIQFVYRGTGETDPREAFQNGPDTDYMVFHATIVAGNGCVNHTIINPLTYDDQKRDLNSWVQIGASAIEGWERSDWNEPVPGNRTANTVKNQGGILLLTYAYDLN